MDQARSRLETDWDAHPIQSQIEKGTPMQVEYIPK